MPRLSLVAAALAAALPLAARADHFMATADPRVVQSFNEIIYTLGQGCQMGNQTACMAIPQVQEHAWYMLNAGYDCQQNVPGACAAYQDSGTKLNEVYSFVSAAAQSGALFQPLAAPGFSGGGMGMTHEERMQQIQTWGQERLEWGRQSQAALDRSHEQFMSTIWE